MPSNTLAMSHDPFFRYPLEPNLWSGLPLEPKEQIPSTYLQDRISTTLAHIKKTSDVVLERDLEILASLVLRTKSIIKRPLRRALQLPHIKAHQLQDLLEDSHYDERRCRLFGTIFPSHDIRAGICLCPELFQRRRHIILAKLEKTKSYTRRLLEIYVRSGFAVTEIDDGEICELCRHADGLAPKYDVQTPRLGAHSLYDTSLYGMLDLEEMRSG